MKIDVVRMGHVWEVHVEGKPLIDGHTGQIQTFTKQQAYDGAYGKSGILHQIARSLHNLSLQGPTG